MNPAQDGGLGVEVIDRNIEEALDLSTEKSNVSNSDGIGSQSPFSSTYDACRSIVITWLQPAVVSMFAISLALYSPSC